MSKQCTQAYAKDNKNGWCNKQNHCVQNYRYSTIVKSLVCPHLKYCISSWSPHLYCNKDQQLLERIQHRFTRMLPGMKELSYTQRLRKLGLWSLEPRRYRSNLIEVYKMLHRNLQLILTLFELEEGCRTRGQSFKLRKSRINTDLRQHCFSERVVNRPYLQCTG